MAEAIYEEDMAPVEAMEARAKERVERLHWLDRSERSAQKCERWSERCSKHLSMLERRVMCSRLLSHEPLRRIFDVFSIWRPTQDLTWGYRTIEDWAQHGVRNFPQVYKSPEEALMRTAEKSFICVRVILEEGLRRNLIACWRNEGVKQGMCSLMVTMRNIEASE